MSNTPTFDQISLEARWIFLGDLYKLMTNDETILMRSNGRGLRLYDELERDPKYGEVLQKRILALVSREWVVEPASSSRKDKKAADLVRAQLGNLGYDQLCKDQLEALNKGVGFNEIMWQSDGSELVAASQIPLEPWIFSFTAKPEKDDTLIHNVGMRLLTPQDMYVGEKIPVAKIMCHRVGAKYNNPWGLGLGNRAFWPIFFKRQEIGFWLAFSERFGTPVPVGKYPNNAQPAEKATLRQALRAFQQESSIMVPIGMEITLLEAARSGIDTYEKLCRYMDEQIAGIVTGEGGTGGHGGQLAAAVNVKNEMRLEIVKADADLLSDTQNSQLVRWIVDYNCPGAGYPKVSRRIEEPKDQKAIAETTKLIYDMGFRPTLANIVRNFGEEWTDVGAKPGPRAPLPENGGDNAGADFAAPPGDEGIPSDQLALDAAMAAFGERVLPDIGRAMLAPILAALKKSGDHQEALEALVASFPEIPLADLQDVMARAIFVGDLVGRLSAQAEIEEAVSRA